MNLSVWLQLERGRAASAARQLSVAGAYMSQMANGVRPVPADMAPAIERMTNLAVRRWDLRPDDWHRIWPELIGADGAPDVPQPAAEAREAACNLVLQPRSYKSVGPDELRATRLLARKALEQATEDSGWGALQ